MVGRENGREKKNKKKIWNYFYITYLFVFFQRKKKKSKDPNGWIMFCFGVEPIKISSPSINTEVALEQVLERCCLLCKENMIFVHPT